MNKPTQYEIDVTRTVLEYLIANMLALEPHAVNTIQDFEDVLGNIPEESDIEEH